MGGLVSLGRTDWVFIVDGSSTSQASRTRIILVTPEGEELEYVIRFNFRTTNNEVDYEVFVSGLKIAHKLSVKHIMVRNDSKLVVDQV